MPDVMLATRGSPDDIKSLQDKGWLFDMKIDGIRCIATITDGEVALVSRTDIDITRCYPDVVESIRETKLTDAVLDGEIVVFDERGLPSWPNTHLRHSKQSRFDHWAQAMPAHLMVFDVLRLDGQDLRGKPYRERRAILEGLPRGPLPTLASTEGEAMWEMVGQYGLEGLIAKRPDSRYREGRSRDWVKIKRTNTVSCLVGGVDPGEGARLDTFGCLHLYLLNEKQHPVFVGKVGSGFSDKDLREVMQALHDPPVMVEVEYLDFSHDRLRQPVFQRIRTDLALTDCTLGQIVAKS